MLFTIRKELGFTREEWFKLNRHDRRMYSEQLAQFIYEKEYDNWKANKQKGPEPVSPEVLMERAEKAMEETTDKPTNVTREVIDDPDDIPDIEDMVTFS